MHLDESTKKSFDFAADSTKQLLALSTGILTLTITFGKDVFQNIPVAAKETLRYAWIGYLASIVFGILTLYALTGTLEPKVANAGAGGSTGAGGGAGGGSGGGAGGAGGGGAPGGGGAGGAGGAPPSPTIRTGSVMFFTALQIITFFVATVFVFKVGVAALGKSSASANDSAAAVEQRVREKQRILVEALLRRDAAALEQNLASDCVIMGSLGQVLNRSHVITAISSGDLTCEFINTDDVSVHLYGETVVETGHAVAKGKYKDQDLSGQFRYSVAFAKKQDDWQVVSVQVARVDQPAGQPVAASAASTGRPKGTRRQRNGGRARRRVRLRRLARR